MTDSANPVARAGDDNSAAPGGAAQGSGRAGDVSSLPRAPRIHAAWLIVPCLAADGLMAPALTLLGVAPGVSVPVALGIVGCVLAQGNLLAAWLAWDDGPFLRRLLTHWKIATGLYLIWLVGFRLATRGSNVPPELAATVMLGVPLVSVAAQFPLWLARQWFGWRLVRASVGPALREPSLRIRDLMLATLVVGAALALARLAPSPDGKTLWPVWGVAVVVAGVISSIALLPAGALLLRPPVLSRGLKWSVAYAAAWIILPWIIVAVVRFYGFMSLPPWQLFVGLSSLMLTFAATLTLAASIARDRGYRLTSRKESSP